MGLVSVAARAGGILAPFLADLGRVSPNLHLLAFGGLMATSAALNMKLPETANMPLPETIEDLALRVSGKVNPRSPAHKYRRVATMEDEV